MLACFTGQIITVYSSRMTHTTQSIRLLLVVSVLATSHSTQAVSDDGPTVTINDGSIRGIRTSRALVFKGVPYARSPTGGLRWRPPQPPVPWRPAVFNATVDAPGCPQSHCEDTTPAIACPTKLSEDCLTVDVFTPLGAKNTTNLAVMVFIHGGNFFALAGSSPLFDGEVFVSRGNVVLVNMNYRLGALGFLVTGRDPEKDATGNYGLMDQRFALNWVKSNVRQFGGDPDKVTVFGQSAGAQSVLNHLTSVDSARYFRYAILESTPIALPYKNFAEAFVLGGLLAEQLGCPVADVKCLRAQSSTDVAEAAYRTRSQVASLKFLEAFEPYGPYIDGVEVKGQPVDVYNAGKFMKKPIIIGTLTEETVLYIYSAFNKSVDLLEYIGVITLARPSRIGKITEHYPPDLTTSDQREMMVKLSTDLVFTCPSNNVSRAMLDQGAPLWSYIWDHAFSFPGWGHVTFCEGRVCHGSELVYVFDTAYKGNFTMTPDETQLSHDVITYWTNFAWTGDPNTPPSFSQALCPTQRSNTLDSSHGTSSDNFKSKSLRFKPKSFREKQTNGQSEFPQVCEDQPMQWPDFTESGMKMWFATPSSKIVSNYKKLECDFWDSIGYA